ncbi:14173_t:CDS:2 [Acaulospora morrowiae]|uniref:14173_t:CDS:1 n=1 Tax=Acaulospora morrowiae TaxID=94023 RepID=A0A9N9A1G7_9GLOM|nr:14173_t:CDS:2 [Acaulospora morrowiae]
MVVFFSRAVTLQVKSVRKQYLTSNRQLSEKRSSLLNWLEKVYLTNNLKNKCRGFVIHNSPNFYLYTPEIISTTILITGIFIDSDTIELRERLRRFIAYERKCHQVKIRKTRRTRLRIKRNPRKNAQIAFTVVMMVALIVISVDVFVVRRKKFKI